MNSLMIFPYYLYWHYARGSRALIKILENIVLFEFHYFSVVELIKNLFAPYKRLKENHGNILNIEAFLSSIVVNIIMRIIGLCIRLVLLTIALIVMLVTVLLIPVLMFMWLILPIVITLLLVMSLWSLLK